MSIKKNKSQALDLNLEASRWDRAYKSDQLRGRDPDRSVMRFLRLELGAKGGRLLDLGCGYGRHLVYFAEEGFDPVGVDLSRTALAGAQRRLKVAAEAPVPLLARAETARLPFAEQSFVGGVSIRVIYHGTREYVLKSLQELKRVLVPGGRMLISFLSDRSSYFGQGEKLENKTYRLEGGIDSGAPHHFFNQADLQRISAEAGLIIEILRLHEFVEEAEDWYRGSTWEAVLRRPVA